MTVAPSRRLHPTSSDTYIDVSTEFVAGKFHTLANLIAKMP